MMNAETIPPDGLFVAPWAKPERAQCKFYHAADLPSGEKIEGDWDLRAKLDEYIGGIDVAGKRVLDLGTASGSVSFHLEKRGATVVSADVASARQYTKVPYFDDPFVARHGEWLKNQEDRIHAMKNSYWYLWHELGSKNRVHYGDLFNLPDGLGLFDVGFIGQIMVHNRDPLGLLQGVAARTTGTIVVSEGMDHLPERTARFMPNPPKNVRPHGWFRFTVVTLKGFLELMGFKVRSVQESEYRCALLNKDVAITTIVADRKPNTMPSKRVAMNHGAS